MTQKNTRQSGFTLIEVLVALAVVAVALAALSRAMGLTAGNQAQLEERIVATWVAQDELTKLQMMPASRKDARQTVKQLERTWVTETERADTLIPDIKKITLNVTLEGNETPSASLVTVVGQ